MPCPAAVAPISTMVPAQRKSASGMEHTERSIFYVSDHTGLTAESLGRSLVAQFPQVRWYQRALPYVNDRAAASSAVREINERATVDGCSPLVVDTLLDPELSRVIATSKGYVLDVFRSFLPGLEKEIGCAPTTVIGAQSASQPEYVRRIDAIQYSMDQDDGCNLERFSEADLVLLGVSRTGKTPTSMYIAIQFGLRTANYPLTETELETLRLPSELEPLRERLFGLTIEPEALAEIRQQRWSDSSYADPRRCQREVQDLLELYRRYGIQYLDVTRLSIEEVAAQALEQLRINRTTKFSGEAERPDGAQETTF